MYLANDDKANGLNMRISLVESRIKGFKKWSDAQCPSDRPRADDGPEMQRQAGSPTRAADSADRAGK